MKIDNTGKTWLVFIENNSTNRSYVFISENSGFGGLTDGDIEKAKRIRKAHPELKGARIKRRRFYPSFIDKYITLNSLR